MEWGRELADVYDRVYAESSTPEVLNPMVDVLASLSGDVLIDRCHRVTLTAGRATIASNDGNVTYSCG